MNKKIIIILSVVIVIAIIIVGVIWLFSKSPSAPGEEKAGILSRLFPSAGENKIGGLPNLPEGEGGQPGGGLPAVGGEEQGSLIQLTQNAISGAAFASTTAVRYIERSTGHIYEISPDGKNRSRVSNTTILKTFETFWSPDANKLILRYFEDSTDKADIVPVIKTFSAVLTAATASTTTPSLQGIFLPQSVGAVITSPEENKIFYLGAIENGVMGILSDFENKKQTSILKVSFNQFNISWPSKNIIALLTKPSNKAEGFFYSLDIKTGKFEKIIGGIKGLTALLSPNGERILYSQSIASGINTKLFDVKEKKSSDFDFTTLAEKCIWSRNDKNIIYCAVPNGLPSGDYPDFWYQGLLSFNDSIWQKNLSTGETKILHDNTGADAINLILNKDGNYLVFTNKKDNTLWSLKLK